MVVCGADGCSELTRPRTALTGSPGASMPSPSSFYAVEISYGRKGSHPPETAFYVPSARMTASSWSEAGFQWSVTPPAAVTTFERIARGLRPFQRPRFEEVVVGGTGVSQPRSYERLFTIQDPGRTDLEEADWERIEFRSAHENPWSLSTLRYSPGSDILRRNLEWVKISPSLARAIEARSSLDRSAGVGLDWQLVGGSLLIGAALAVTAALLIRRDSSPRSESV
ncbi:MAG: hypothetical protein MSC30_08455 [Gaiellaceae bacterium MAG52_C11]|nr:hypothetical protein [Candidatus Gaiellasilicea maunaloa]